MPGWDNFFVARVGASAALAGLMFVGISINLAKIVATLGLTGRAFEGLVALIQVLVAASLMLVPDQSMLAISIELIIVGLATWLTMVVTQIRYWRGRAVSPLPAGSRRYESGGGAAVYACRCAPANRGAERFLLDRPRHHFLVPRRAAECLGAADRDQSLTVTTCFFSTTPLKSDSTVEATIDG